MGNDEIWAAIDPATLSQFVSDFEEIERAQKYNKLALYQPSPKQLEFFAAGKWADERMLRAGNQLGKSDAGAVEAAIHATGLYPSWWDGHRFSRATRGWICGESLAAVRDIQQTKLVGRPGVEAEFGTGLIPKHLFVGRPTASHGATGGFDTIFVKHVSGGVSTMLAKAYEQGRLKSQGEPVDWIWPDEEPPFDIYDEYIARTIATRGIVFVTYTPLKGRTQLVSHFDRFDPIRCPKRCLIKMTIWDCMGHVPHLPDRAAVEAVIAKFPEHQRQARAYGDPVLGEGAIFDTPEEKIKWRDPKIMPHWPLLWGVDFGISHPFAAVLIAWDRDNDVIYVVDGFRVANQTKLQHVPRMRGICAAAPVAWPKDGHDRDKGSGEELAEQYKCPMPGMPGLNMLPDHATFEEGGYSTEAGVVELVARAATGRLMVAEHLVDFFEEYRDYHRENGLIVKINDDMLSALRTAVIQRRSARLVPMGEPTVRYLSLGAQKRDNRDRWDIFTGEPI